MIKLSDYIKDAHSEDIRNALGIDYARFEEISIAVLKAATILHNRNDERKMLVLEELEKAGFIPQSLQEVTLVIYSLFPAFHHLQKQKVINNALENFFDIKEDLPN